MRKVLIFSLIAAGALVVANLLPTSALAAGISEPWPSNWTVPSSLEEWIQSIFRLLVIVGAIVAFVLLIIGGVQYLTAAGNEEATGKAKRLLLDAVIGLVIVLAAWALGTYMIEYFTGTSPEVPNPINP